MSFQLQSVLITDEIDAQCVEILQKNGIQVVKNTKLTKEQLVAEIPVSIYNTSTITRLADIESFTDTGFRSGISTHNILKDSLQVTNLNLAML